MNNHHFINLFEQELAKYTGAPYVVLTDSCSNALFLCAVFLKKYKKDILQDIPIELPCHNYISAPMQLIHAGYEIKFKNDKWHGQYQVGYLPIVDAAQRFTQNMYKEKTYTCLSFQQKKILNIGKGGAILLDNKEDYEILKRMAWDGRDSSTPVDKDKGIILGYHMNMIPDDACRGLLLLNNLPNKIADNGGWEDYPDISKYDVFNNK